MSKKRQSLHPDAPLLHPDHPRPRTRREFLRQGLVSGGAMVTGPTLMNLFLHPEEAKALSADISSMDVGTSCLSNVDRPKIPFIAFDLAGGANFASSNVLVGKQGGQLDPLDAAGYRLQGIPSDRIPNGTAFTNSELGLLFHSESALLAGILSKLSPGARAFVNGAVIPARSENDTGNNPHNPMYAIARVGAKGNVTTLIGSVNSDSGSNSQAPALMINPAIRPIKVDRPTDVTGLVDTGDLTSVLSQADAVRVMESVARISNMKVNGTSTGLAGADETRIKQLVRCGYVKAADTAERFGSTAGIDPAQDTRIVGAGGIFSTTEFNGDAEFRKTASVMKMCVNHFSGAGSVTMGGYDYHTGDRIAGERRDLRAGKCIGACLEYAFRLGMPLMVYIYSDGSVFSNGTLDNTALTDTGTGTTISLPGGKGVWTGDSSTTACSFFMVINPPSVGGSAGGGVKPALVAPTRQQLGYFRANGSVETNATPVANNVNLLVELVALNYMALHGLEGSFANAGLFPTHGLGASYANLIAFNQLQGLPATYSQF